MARQGSRTDKKLDEFDSIWLEDPKTLGLVTSQVEDPKLVRLRRGQFVRSAIEVFW